MKMFESVLKECYVHAHASLFISGHFFIVGGGADQGYSSKIARLNPTDWSWSIAGRINNPRLGRWS